MFRREGDTESFEGRERTAALRNAEDPEETDARESERTTQPPREDRATFNSAGGHRGLRTLSERQGSVK